MSLCYPGDVYMTEIYKMRTTLTMLATLTTLWGCGSHTQAPQHAGIAPLPEGVTLVETHEGKPGALAIPYRKYRLDNGLTVLLHKDSSDPLVHVDVTYHVGSAREEPGKSGFAHFFEHMMFQGSENVADEQHFKIVTEAGGTLNGTTNRDRTNYFQTVPNNQLEKMLWLESDRMGYLLGAVTQEKFEVQRETVKNERGQRYDNRPYGLMREKIAEALYPNGHPYSWMTIGYVDDLDRVDVNDLKAFFLRWYGPNNATLTIGGDIDEAQTLAWVKKYFGGIPRGPEVKDAAKAPARLTETRYLTHEDQVHMPLLSWTIPTVYAHHEDEAALDVLADILGSGKTSLFYKNLVKQGVAVQAGVSHPCAELACTLSMYALANPEKVANLGELDNIIKASLDEFEQRGVSLDDLNRTKMAIESRTIFGLQTVSGKVSTLAANETFYHQPDLVQQNIDRYAAVTQQDVMRVYRQYVKGKHKVVLSIVPRGKTGLQAKAPNFSFTRTLGEISRVGEDELKLRAAKADFDRSVTPPSGPNPETRVPEYWQATLGNGIKVMGAPNDETPTVYLQLNMEGGPLLDPIDKAGLASFTAAMMNEATQNFSNEALANELKLLGSAISFSASGRYTTVSLSSLTKNLDKTLTLLEEKLLRPKFDPADFARIKARTLQSVKQSMKNASTLSNRASLQLLYGQNNRLGLPQGGTLASIQAITLDDVKAFYERYYSPAMANLIVVGDKDKTDMLAKLEFLEKWQGQQYSLPSFAGFPRPDKPAIYFVHKPGAAQSVVSVLKHAMPFDAHGEYYRSTLMNFPLGGAFNSRINLNLREDKGYTYGARAGFRADKERGRFVMSASVKKDNTADALAEMLKELTTFNQSGMNDEELAFMRQAIGQRDALKYESLSQKAGFLRMLLTYDMTPQDIETRNELVQQIKKAELNALAKKHLNPASMQMLVVGDKDSVLPQLATLGYPVKTIQLIP